MSKRIVQVNFKFHVPAPELVQAFAPMAQPIADTPGLRWKIWLMNAEPGEAGGIYLFDDEVSVQAYMAGPIIAAVKSNPVLSQITVKEFGVLDGPTAVTRGPIREGARV